MNFSKQITKSNNSNNSYICDTILLEKDLHQKDLANFAFVWLIQSSKVCSQRILLRYFWISLLSYYLFQFSGFYKIPCNWRTKQDCDIGFWRETNYQITKKNQKKTVKTNKKKKKKIKNEKKFSKNIRVTLPGETMDPSLVSDFNKFVSHWKQDFGKAIYISLICLFKRLFLS